MAKDRRRKRWVAWGLLLGVFLSGLVLVILLLARMPSRSEKLYREGLVHLRQQKPTEAVAAFRGALEDRPDYLEAREGLIQALTEQKDFVGALQEVDEAVAGGLSEAEALLLKAKVLKRRAEHRVTTAGPVAETTFLDDVIESEIEPAIQLIVQCAKLHSEPVRIHTFLGNLYFQKSDLLRRKRFVLLDEAGRAENAGRPDVADSRSLQAEGIIELIAGAQVAGLQAYEQAIASGDSLALDARMALARHALNVEVPSPERVESMVKPILADNPKHAGALKLIAEAGIQEGDYEAAVDAIDLIPDDRKDEAAQRLKAEALLELERYHDAETLLRSMVRPGAPAPSRTAFYLGKALLAPGRSEEAAREAATILQNIFARSDVSYWPEARYQLGLARLRAGQRQQGLAALREVLRDADSVAEAKLKPARRQEITESRVSAGLVLADELETEAPEEAFEYAHTAFRWKPASTEALEEIRTLVELTGRPQEIYWQHLAWHVAELTREKGIDAALDVCDREIERADIGFVSTLQTWKAELYVMKGAYRQAILQYDNILSRDPDHLQAAMQRASLLHRVRRFDEALAAYQNVLNRHPGHAGALAGKLRTLVEMGDVDAAAALLTSEGMDFAANATDAVLKGYLKEGRHDVALNLVAAQVNAHPDNPSVRATFAQLLLMAGRLEESRKQAELILETGANSRASYVLGLTHLILGEPAEGVGVYREALQEASDRDRARITANLALALFAEDRPGEAISSLEAELANAGSNDAAWNHACLILALMHAAQANLDKAFAASMAIRDLSYGTPEDRRAFLEALADLNDETISMAASDAQLLVLMAESGLESRAEHYHRRLKELLPDQPLPDCWFALALAKAGKHAAAIEHYNEALKSYEDSLSPRIGLAGVYYENGDMEAVIKELRRIAVHARGLVGAEVHRLLGSAYGAVDRIEEAAQHYEAALENNPDDPVALNNLAVLRSTRMGDPKGALPLAQRACDLKRWPAIRDTLGWAQYLAGRPDEALNNLLLAQAGLSRSPTIRYHLGRVYQALGQEEKARAEFEEALNISFEFPEADETRQVLRELKR